MTAVAVTAVRGRSAGWFGRSSDAVRCRSNVTHLALLRSTPPCPGVAFTWTWELRGASPRRSSEVGELPELLDVVGEHIRLGSGDEAADIRPVPILRRRDSECGRSDLSDTHCRGTSLSVAVCVPWRRRVTRLVVVSTVCVMSASLIPAGVTVATRYLDLAGVFSCALLGGAPMGYVNLWGRVGGRRRCRRGASRRARRLVVSRGRGGLGCGAFPERSSCRSRSARPGRPGPRTRTGRRPV